MKVERTAGVELEGEVESPEALAFQHREWRAERAGWVMVGGLLLAGALGLLGDGPLARSTAVGPGARVQLEYPRVSRLDTAEHVRIQVVPAPAGGALTLEVWQPWLDDLRLDHVTPEPERVAQAGDWTAFVFARRDPTMPATVTLQVTSRRAGTARGAVRLPGEPPVRFTQLVLP